MLADILINALQKIKSNRTGFLLAAFGIILSSFITLVIFSVSHISKEILISYLCNKHPAIDFVTVKISDEKYYMSVDEILDLYEKQNVKNITFQASETVIGHLSGNRDIKLQGIYGLPFSARITDGKGISNAEFLSKDCRKVVIHKDLAEELFGNTENAQGRSITVCSASGKDCEFVISGIYENSDYQSKDTIYGSFGTVTSLYGINKNISKFFVQVNDLKKITQLKMSLATAIHSRYKLDNYDATIMTGEILKSVNMLISLITTIFLVFVCIIFIVSGINIRNILLSIMNTYTHLIGIQKAIGAMEGVIAAEYLVMGGMVAFISTLFSIGLFGIVSSVINLKMNDILKYAASNLNLDFLADMSLNLSVNGVELFFSLILSCFIVILCCYKSISTAVRMKIVDALRT